MNPSNNRPQFLVFKEQQVVKSEAEIIQKLEGMLNHSIEFASELSELTSKKVSTPLFSINEKGQIIGLNLSRLEITEEHVKLACELKNMERLILCGTTLLKIPSCLKNLISLEYLDLSYSPIRSFPPIFIHLKRIKHLNLARIGYSKIKEFFAGQIKDGAFNSLISLDLSYNSLLGLPENIGRLKSLESLNIHKNRLNKLPESMKNLASLKFLSISENNFNKSPEILSQIPLQSLEMDFKLRRENSNFLLHIDHIEYKQNLTPIISWITALMHASKASYLETIKKFFKKPNIGLDQNSYNRLKRVLKNLISREKVVKMIEHHHGQKIRAKYYYISELLEELEDFLKCILLGYYSTTLEGKVEHVINFLEIIEAIDNALHQNRVAHEIFTETHYFETLYEIFEYEKNINKYLESIFYSIRKGKFNINCIHDRLEIEEKEFEGFILNKEKVIEDGVITETWFKDYLKKLHKLEYETILQEIAEKSILNISKEEREPSLNSLD